MKGLAALVLSFLAALPATIASEPEVVFHGDDIELSKEFVCGSKSRAGRYTLEVNSTEGPEKRTVLKVMKGDKVLCEVQGSASQAFDSMSATKVRVFTRLNKEAKAIQIDLIMPNGSRSRIPNQAFLLPLADER